MSAANTPVILAAKRTPIGKFFGGLSKVPSPVIGSYAIGGLFAEQPKLKDAVDECIMGCVLQAGLGIAGTEIVAGAYADLLGI